MRLSFSSVVASSGVLLPGGTFCGRCALHSTRRATQVPRRRRAKLYPHATVSPNGTAGNSTFSNTRPRSKTDDSDVGATSAGSSAFSAAYARGSLSALMREYIRLASAEPFILRRLAAAMFCVVAGKFIGLTVPFLFKRAVDALSVPGVSIRAFAAILLMHCAAKIAASMARELRNGVFAKAGQRVGRRITALSFAHILSMEAAFHNASHTGALTRVVDRGTRSVLTIFRGVLFAFLPTIFELVLVCGVLFASFSAWYVVVTLITFVLFVGYTFAINNRMGELRAAMNAVDNETSAKLTDSFFNVDAVTAFDNSRFELERYDASLRKAERLSIENEWLYATLNFGQGAIFATGLTIMLWMSANAIAAARMTVGSFVMLSSMLQQLWVPLNFLGWQYREVKQSLIDLQNLFQVLKRQSAIKDSEGAAKLVVTGGGIEFEGVGFTYPGEQDADLEFIRKPTEFGSMLKRVEGENGAAVEERREALKELSFSVAPGKSLALVGPSGSGKSSTLRLLYRLYDISKGRILIDGQDISKVTLSSLRQAVSIVPQDTVLFNDTIAYNLRYGRPSATDEEVIAAAKAASIHETIMRTPQGYETLVGERGVKLSGGERQRLSVARAFLKGSRIILEDESTSSLDSLMEMEVTQALKELGVDRTRVIVAHRLSTILDADHIVVIQLGRKVEEGTHEQLIANPNGVYREMWARQQDNRAEVEVVPQEPRRIYHEPEGDINVFDDLISRPPYTGDVR